MKTPIAIIIAALIISGTILYTDRYVVFQTGIVEMPAVFFDKLGREGFMIVSNREGNPWWFSFDDNVPINSSYEDVLERHKMIEKYKP